MNPVKTISLLSALALMPLAAGCATTAPAETKTVHGAASVTGSMSASASSGGGSRASSASASADAFEGLRSRASCASIDMAIALGERVSKKDRELCAGRPKPKPKPPVTAVAPTAKQAEVLSAPPIKAHSSPPDWIERPPVERGMIYGVGEGAEAKQAFAKAMDMCAGQVKASIHSEMEEESSQSVQTVGGRESVSSSENLSSTSKMLVRAVLEDVRIVDQYVDQKAGRTYVLASFDMAALQAKKQAIVESVLESIADATEKLTRSIASGKLDQSDITAVVNVLVDITAIGRTRMGRELKAQWLKPYRQLKNAVSLLVECLEVRSQSGGKLPQPMKPGAVALKVTCRGVPVTNASMVVNVSNGLASAPNTTATDGDGLVEMRVAHTYGKGEVQLALRHDLSAIRNSDVLGKISDSPRARWTMSTQGPAKVTMKVIGVKGTQGDRISEGVGAWLAQKFGADVVKRGAHLESIIRMNIETSVNVGDKYTQPLRWQITVQGKGGTVFDRKGKTGVLADSPEKAVEDAITSMFQRINRW